jgi:hypothetical protein
MRFLIAAAVGLSLVAGAAAHEKFKIVGTVVALKTNEIAVKAVDGATYEIDFTETAVVTDKQHKKIDRAKLKVGEKVTVLALGHDMFDLEAYEVQLTGHD